MGEFEREAQRAGLFNGPLSSCETELQELMRQIDIMMAGRKKEWGMDIHALQARLDIKEKDLTTNRALMETKHKELGQLRHNLETTEASQQNLTMQYDKQISQLRNELGNLQKDYARLQKHHGKQALSSEKIKDGKILEAEKLMAELLQATSVIHDLQEKSNAWEAQRRSYRHQVESLESQRKTLAEKSQLFQQQALGYQEQLTKRRHIQEHTDINFKSQLVHCQAELNRAQDRIEGKNNSINNLERTLEEMKKNNVKQENEKRRMKEELHKANFDMQQLEEEITQTRLELHSRDDLLKVSEQDNQHQSQDISQLEESLLLKDDIIRTLKCQSEQQETVEVDRLCQQLEVKQLENRELVENRQTLQQEMSRLQQSLDVSQRECEELNLELANKIDELRHLEGTELTDLADKYSKLSEKCHNQDDFFKSTMEGMKQEIASLTAELHQRDSSVARLTVKISTMEKQTRNEGACMNDVESLTSQFEAVRLENKSLREWKETLENQQADFLVSDLQVVQDQYNEKTRHLEEENRVLRQHLGTLQLQLKSTECTHGKRLTNTVHETDMTVAEMKEEEERKLETLKLEHRIQIQELRNRLSESVNRYESEIERLKNDQERLRLEIRESGHSIKKLQSENQAMMSCVDDVKSVTHSPSGSSISSPAKRQLFKNPNTSQEMLSFPELITHTEAFQYERPNSRASVTGSFVAENKKRTSELEELLNNHITDLEKKTHETLGRYIPHSNPGTNV